MSIVETEQLPSGLIHAVSKLSYFKTERRKLQPDVNSVSPSGVVRLKLPTSGLLSLSSLSWHSKVSVATADSVVPTLGAFVSRLAIYGDGQILDEISNYSLLFTKLMNISCSDAHARTRYTASTFMPRPDFVAVDVAITSTDATKESTAETAIGGMTTNGCLVQRNVPTTIASGASKWGCEVDWLGFLSLDYIMADLFPAITVEMSMEGNNILGSSNGTWSMSDMYFVIDVINYASALESMMALFERNANTISPISYAFDRYITQTISGQASTTNTLTFNVASSNLRKILYTYRKNAFATQAVVVAGNHASNYYVFSAGDASANFTTMNLYHNGRQYYQFPLTIYENASGEVTGEAFVDMLKSLGVESDNQYDCLVNSQNDYLVRKFCGCVNFDWRGSGAEEISGLNTQGQSDFVLSINSDSALTAGGQFLVTAQCSALLHVSPNRSVVVEL